MLRREIGLTEKANEKIEEHNADPKTKTKMASLTPYLAEIQRRKRMRSTNKRSNKNLNESSSKSFRIKQKSLTSLHKELAQRPRENNNNLIIKRLEEQINKQRRTRSVQRNHESQISRTLESKGAVTKASNNFFNDLYARVKSKVQKQRQGRRKQYQTLEQNRTRSEQAGELNMYKISYTNMTALAKDSRRQQIPKGKTQQPNPKKTNFRRNKYQVLQASTGQQPSKINMQKQQYLSEGRIVLDKKQSNLTINMQMDRLAQKQMQNFYQQVITKQIHRSIEKSTEKYFNYESYRPTRSKNDIEVYINTLVNPNANKLSKSTNEKSECKKDRPDDFLDYDFQFKKEENEPTLIYEGSVEDQESHFQVKYDIDQFQRQRKKVEIQFFNKPEPHLDWSQDQCKIDQI